MKGIQGVRESVDPPNNNGYERTLGLTYISQAVDALLPFVDASAAAKAGFNTLEGVQVPLIGCVDFYSVAPDTPTRRLHPPHFASSATVRSTQICGSDR